MTHTVRASNANIEAFLSNKDIAIVGVSRDEKQFANAVFHAMRARGFMVYAVNKTVDKIGDERSYRSVAELPGSVRAAAIFVRRESVMEVLEDIRKTGIRNIWLQQGTESPASIEYCRANQMDVVAGECLMMYAEPVNGVHKFHRWLRHAFGGK